ncbi:hypothetical protein [Euryhalocaulis caribicus]|uniref:hypothetical protein n=1 Tax=Euryhalocaulis caribicus TaxID=1161401 RepID=UPI0003B43D54|nr:hypothetical protein [Euryhalocaulis caribicus]
MGDGLEIDVAVFREEAPGVREAGLRQLRRLPENRRLSILGHRRRLNAVINAGPEKLGDAEAEPGWRFLLFHSVHE